EHIAVVPPERGTPDDVAKKGRRFGQQRVGAEEPTQGVTEERGIARVGRVAGGDPRHELRTDELEEDGRAPHHLLVRVEAAVVAVRRGGEVASADDDRLPERAESVPDADDEHRWEMRRELHAANDV